MRGVSASSRLGFGHIPDVMMRAARQSHSGVNVPKASLDGRVGRVGWRMFETSHSARGVGRSGGRGAAALLVTAATIASGGTQGSRAMCAGGGEAGSGMIEVEQKFHIDEGTAERVGKSLQFKGEKLMKDTYFDITPAYPLTCTDHWLRLRDGAWELKQPISLPAGVGGGSLDTYREITEEGELAEALERLLGFLPGALTAGREAGLLERLMGVGCVPFCTIVSRRRKYAGGGISVDLDEVVEPEGMDYSIGEVEVMAEGEDEILRAQQRIEEFIRDNGIQTQSPSGKVALGKVLSVIHRSSPDHFGRLRDALGSKYPKLTQV